MAGNLTRITSPNGRYVTLSYDASNRVSQLTDVQGRTVTYTYDASGRLWKVTDPAGGLTEYTYDASHQLLTVKDARGNTHVTNTYDANGRVATQTQSDGTGLSTAVPATIVCAYSGSSARIRLGLEEVRPTFTHMQAKIPLVVAIRMV
ncbi:MAG: hypothetical protein U0172_02205 [Nitrospiraceae bacterium]